MAKRKYAKKGVARRLYTSARRTARRSYKRAGQSAGISLLSVGFHFGYGYGRSFLTQNDLAQKAMNAIPFGGDFKDNILLGGGAFVASLLLKPSHPMVKLGLRTIVDSEAFLAGAKMRMGASITSSALTSDNNSGEYV